MQRRISEIDALLSSCTDSDRELDQLRSVLERQKKVLEDPTQSAVDEALRSLSKLYRGARRVCHRLRREKEKRLRREVEQAVENARSLLVRYQQGAEMSVACGGR